MSENINPPGPHNLPKCRHGEIFNPNRSCPECVKDDKAIKSLVHPLIDEYWNSKGKDDLYHVVYRAYRMGMRGENLK